MRIAFKKTNQNLPLSCESIGFHWRQNPVNRPQGYLTYHWIQSETGTGIINIDQQKMTLNPNQGILIRQGVPHSYRASSPQKIWQTSFLTFYGPLADELTRFLALNKFLFLPTLTPELVSFISQTYSEFTKDNLIAALEQSAQLYRFIMLIKQNNYYASNNFQEQHVVVPIISYIAQHYSLKVTNERLSSITNFSVSYQNRVFKKKYGVTPLQYLNDYRLRKAKSFLIIHPEWPVQKVGNMVGFNDISRFIRQFKKCYRLTPQQFRKII